MKIFKKALAIMSLALAFTPSVHAGEINIGGVVFDPDYNDGVEFDFIGDFKFTQWYAPTSSAKGVLNNFASAATIGSVLATLDITSSSATGFYLQGAGKFDGVNDPLNDFSTGFGALGSFCPGCQLTYAFGGIGLNKNNTFDITNAWAQIYVDKTTDFHPPVNDNADAQAAIDGQVWLDLEILALAFQPGANPVLNGVVSATLGVIGGLAENNFLPKELSYTGDAHFQSLQLGMATKYSLGGNGSVIGNTVPEPASIAMLGIGLLGLAFSRRRKQQS